MRHFLSNLFGSGSGQQESPDACEHRAMTWDEVFAGCPTAPGTQVEQERHKALREKGRSMTEEEEEELNRLFYAIYPQFHPEVRKDRP